MAAEKFEVVHTQTAQVRGLMLGQALLQRAQVRQLRQRVSERLLLPEAFRPFAFAEQPGHIEQADSKRDEHRQRK